MQIEDAVSLCMKNGIKVYPVSFNNNHKIEYSRNGIPEKTFDKVLINSKEVNNAIIKTYIYLAKRIK